MAGFFIDFQAIPPGFEPGTHSLEGCCSIQLSYGTICKISTAKLQFFSIFFSNGQQLCDNLDFTGSLGFFSHNP